MKISITILLAGLAIAGPAHEVKPKLMPHSKSNPAVDPTNEPPPTGAILDLNGTPVPGGGNSTYQQYSVTFVAALANTAITFAFREDPAFLHLEEVTVVDQTVSGPNLLVNGDFSGGVYTNNGNSAAAVDWTYANIYGAEAGGTVDSECGGPQASGYCWSDGAVQAYDAISQTIPTTIGHTYKISFYLADTSGCDCNFSRLSTNGDTTNTGGNGIDLLVYAQAGLPSANATPAATPAPPSAILGMFGLAAMGLFFLIQRRRIRV